MRFGITPNYYIHSNPEKKRPGKQIRGSFPAKGYCAACFVGSNRFRRLSEEKQKEIRRALAG